jgi:hypothetical protein
MKARKYEDIFFIYYPKQSLKHCNLLKYLKFLKKIYRKGRKAAAKSRKESVFTLCATLRNHSVLCGKKNSFFQKPMDFQSIVVYLKSAIITVLSQD